jgi:hypothetical protein
MKTPTAVLLGFLMVSVAIVVGPIVQNWVVLSANAQGLEIRDHRMFLSAFGEIASAINNISACHH